MPNTYTELRQTVLGSNTPSVTLNLSGISGYTDLRLVINGGATVYGGCRMQFNGDTASNYSDTYILGTGSGSGSSGRDVSLSYVSAGYPLTTTLTSLHTVDFMNYANTTTNKTILGRSSDAASITLAQVGLWRSTAAITSILLYPASGNFLSGTTFSLYGIANADQGAAKATGGIITEDSQYWYHTFGASGAFVPKQSLTADVLVIAGGGGGGDSASGGGGAGGYRLLTSQSLAVQSYTCTVGSGGPGASSSTGVRGTTGVNSVFDTITSAGGGGGGADGVAGGNGGSGGGAGYNSAPVGLPSPTGQGNEGGTGNFVASNGGFAGGGGGGAGSAGISGVSTSAGGAGSNSASTWAAVTGTGVNGFYAGGGGGARGSSLDVAVGGSGGGGVGAKRFTSNATSGTANTGGGGGGGDSFSSRGPGGNGGSGIVIVRYPK
jgi:hypothetical protein